MRRVGLCNLNKTTLLKQCSWLKSNVIGLKGREGQACVPALTGVLLLFKVDREGSNDLCEIALLVLSRRNREEWAQKVSGHQRRPSDLSSKRGLPRRHVVPVWSEAMRKLICRPRRRK